jgi:hypothetical protein
MIGTDVENLALKYDYFVLFTINVGLQISGDLTKSRRIILNGIYKKSVIRTWTGIIWMRIGPSGRLS